MKNPIISHILCLKNKEAQALCKKHDSCLQETSVEDIASIEWNMLLLELEINAPEMMEMLYMLTNRSHDSGECDVVFVAAVILFKQNPKMSRLQYMIGLLLDQNRITNEVSKV